MMCVERILICGGNGILGAKILNQILDTNHKSSVRLLIRDKDKIHPLLTKLITNNDYKHRIRLFKADLLMKQSLYGITDNIDGIISCITPSKSRVIIDGQRNLLDEIIRSNNIKNIKKFIPSEFGLNMVECYKNAPNITKLNSSIMCRLKFREILTSQNSKYKDLFNYTFIHCGTFMEGIFGWLNHLNWKKKTFYFYNNGTNNLNITCTDDIAKWTAAVIFDINAPKEMYVIGDTINCKEIINILNKKQNKLKAKSLGNIGVLKSKINTLSKIPNRNIGHNMVLTFFCYEYLMFSGYANFSNDQIDKSKQLYHNLQTTSLNEYLSDTNKSKSWVLDAKSWYPWKQIHIFPNRLKSKM